MANEILIAHENTEKQKNLDAISLLESNSSDIDLIIDQLNANIVAYEASKVEILQQISDLEDENVLIDEIIAILSA